MSSPTLGAVFISYPMQRVRHGCLRGWAATVGSSSTGWWSLTQTVQFMYVVLHGGGSL